MANVIEIVIHATDAATAQIKGARNAVTGLQASFGSLLGVVGGPAGAAALLGAAGLAGISMANDFADAVEELDNLSRITGVSVNRLRELQTVLREAGKSPDLLNNSLVLLKRKLEDNDKALRAIVGDTDDVFEALVRISAAGGTASQAFTAFGRAGVQVAAILPELSENLADVHRRTVQLGPDALAAARDYDRAMDEMKTATGNLAAVAVPVFAKAMVASITILSAAAALMKKNVVQAFSDMIRAIATLAGNVVEGPKKGVPGAGGGGDDTQAVLASLSAMALRMPGDRPGSEIKYTPQIVAATQAQWKALADTWNEADNAALNLEATVGDLDTTLQEFGTTSANVIASSFRSMFDQVLIEGRNFVESLGDMLKNVAGQIASIALQIGLGVALNATGVPFLGQIGRALGAGSLGSGGGNTYVIQSLETGTLASAMRPGGSWNRASDVVRIGSRY